MGLLDQGLQFLAGVEGHDAARCDGNLLTGLGVASGALRLVPKLKIAEPRQLDALAAFEGQADLFEERLHHVLRLALVQTDLLKKHVRKLGFRQCHFCSLGGVQISLHFITQVRNLAPNFAARSSVSCAIAASASASVNVLAVSCITTRNARLFLPLSTPLPR